MKTVIILVMAAMFCPVDSYAEEIDPVIVSSSMYKVLLENEHVRVVRYSIQPGERDDWHTHPAKFSYVVSGGTLRITLDDRGSFDITEETGDASWMPALGKHFAENVGDRPVSIVLVEVKSANEDSDQVSKSN